MFMLRTLQFGALAGAVLLSSCSGSSVEPHGTSPMVPQAQALPEAVGPNATFKEYLLPDGSAAGPGTIVSGHLWVPTNLTYVYNVTSGGATSLVPLNAPALCNEAENFFTCEFPKAATVAGAFVWFLDAEQTPNLANPGAPLSEAVLFAVNPTTGAVVRELVDNLTNGEYQETPGENVVQGADFRLWYTECINEGNPGFFAGCYVVGSSSANGGTAYYIGTNIGRVLASGYDGRLYLTETSSTGAAADVARITTSGTVVHRYPLPTGSLPFGIAGGCDHNLWIVLSEANKIARLSVTGAMTEFTIPTPSSGAVWITLGLDGNMWFTESRANKIARITPTGAITEYKLPIPISEPNRITGPYAGNCPHLAHGYFWFTELGRAALGKLSF